MMQARLFKQLNVHGPSLPLASSDNSDYDTAEEGDGPERLQQNGHGQAVREAAAEADSLALPPGLSMGGPLMHNLPDEVLSAFPQHSVVHQRVPCWKGVQYLAFTGGAGQN